MLKKLLNAHIDLLGEDRAGKILEKIQSPSANYSEQTLSEVLSQFAQSEPRSNGLEVTEGELPQTPEIVELKACSPAIYWTLVTACEYRTRKRKKHIDRTALASTVRLRIKNATSIEPPYKACAHAANLASPHYAYTYATSDEGWRTYVDDRDIRRTVIPYVEPPKKDLYLLDYCNSDFRKVLFATCCYHGLGEERLPNVEALVKLLVDLGFTDRHVEDYTSSFITLITGALYKREKYTHF